MSLSARERVEKILMYLPGDLFDYRSYLEAQIEESEREAFAKGLRAECPFDHKEIYQEGWTAAKMKAKGIASNFSGNYTDPKYDWYAAKSWIAARIEAMEADG